MNPTKNGFGIMQAFQKEIFPLVKEQIPGFIHSMTGKEYTDLVKGKIKPDWKAISIDGSAFDSSQYAPLMRSVDNRFFENLKPFIRQIIQHNWESFKVTPLVSIDQMTTSLMKSLTSTSNTVFIKAPGVNAPDWPEPIR